MIKRRPVVVLAAHKRNAKLVAVVPLSTTRPNPVEEYHFQLLRNPLADSAMKEVWAKCDMVAVVSTQRLELIRTGRRLSNGRREYVTAKIGQEQFDEIRPRQAVRPIDKARLPRSSPGLARRPALQEPGVAASPPERTSVDLADQGTAH
jgi:mRNA interferase MazF